MEATTYSWWVLIAVALLSAILGAAAAHIRTERLRRDCRRIFMSHAKAVESVNDSLLQGFLGIAWHMDAATSMLPNQPEESKARMYAVLDRLDQVLQDARQNLWDLKQHPWLHEDLTVGLQRQADAFFAASGNVHRLVVSGKARRVAGEVAHSLAFIVRESWSIARKQNAGRVLTKVDFQPQELVIQVTESSWRAEDKDRGAKDNGVGVRAIQRRAKVIDATMAMESTEGGGRAIVIRVPAGRAFEEGVKKESDSSLRFFRMQVL